VLEKKLDFWGESIFQVLLREINPPELALIACREAVTADLFFDFVR